MRDKPATLREWIVYGLAFVLVQGSTMYVCLRVFHWNFFLSAFLAAALAVGFAMLAVSILRRGGNSSTGVR